MNGRCPEVTLTNAKGSCVAAKTEEKEEDTFFRFLFPSTLNFLSFFSVFLLRSYVEILFFMVQCFHTVLAARCFLSGHLWTTEARASKMVQTRKWNCVRASVRASVCASFRAYVCRAASSSALPMIMICYRESKSPKSPSALFFHELLSSKGYEIMVLSILAIGALDRVREKISFPSL